MYESGDTIWNGTAAHNQMDVHTIFLVFNCVVLSLTFLLGLPGNMLVCWVVYRTKSLQTANNALLVNLAASDLLKCFLDPPLLVFSFLRHGKGMEVPVSVCALQQFTYALCSCVQLLTLVGISVERFQAIAFPFQTERKKTRIRVWILSIWACGLILAIVSLTLSSHLYTICPRYAWKNDKEHLEYVDPFGTYVLVPVWGCSLTVIIVHYTRIFKVVRQHGKKVFDSGIKLKPTVARHVWSWLGVSASVPRTAPLRSLHSLPMVEQPTDVMIVEDGPSCANRSQEAAPRRPPEIVGAVCLLTPCARERGKKRTEGKLAERVGYIIITFTLFWMPMVVTLVINIVVGHGTDFVLMELETSAMVLTHMPAAVDPIIYSLVTRQFRSEFSRVLSSIHGFPLRLRRQRVPSLGLA